MISRSKAAVDRNRNHLFSFLFLFSRKELNLPKGSTRKTQRESHGEGNDKGRSMQIQRLREKRAQNWEEESKVVDLYGCRDNDHDKRMDEKT